MGFKSDNWGSLTIIYTAYCRKSFNNPSSEVGWKQYVVACLS